MYCHFVASFLTGIVAAMATASLDLVKTRMMMEKSRVDAEGKYTGIFDCLMKTY